MEEWKKALQWHAREEQEERRKEQEDQNRHRQVAVEIVLITAVFGGLALVVFDTASAGMSSYRARSLLLRRTVENLA